MGATVRTLVMNDDVLWDLDQLARLDVARRGLQEQERLLGERVPKLLGVCAVVSIAPRSSIDWDRGQEGQLGHERRKAMGSYDFDEQRKEGGQEDVFTGR